METLEAISNLDQLRQLCLDCRRCPLRAGCQGVVFARGNPHAKLMLIGEGPGAEEDKQGLPFVGAAGQLLDKILTAAGFAPEDVYIANIVKCRPPGNRVPTPEEAAACRPWLMKQIQLVAPKVMVLLGSTALVNLVDKQAKITKMRGHWLTSRSGIKVMPTYHPAALLRDPAKKRDVWEDMQKVRECWDILNS